MRYFRIMPEKGNWFDVEASNHEMAFRGVCNWYSYDRRIAVMDKDDKTVKIFKIKPGGVRIIENHIEEV